MPATSGAGPAVTWASLQSDLLAAQERAIRLAARIQQLERRLCEALSEQAWHQSGLSTPADIDPLRQQASQHEQQAIDQRLQLEERDQDLAAARAANRELMAQLNAAPRHREHATQHPCTAPVALANISELASELRKHEILTLADRPTPPGGRIRNAKDTGLRSLPLHGYAQNQLWCEIAALASELIAWAQMLARHVTPPAAGNPPPAFPPLQHCRANRPRRPHPAPPFGRPS